MTRATARSATIILGPEIKLDLTRLMKSSLAIVAMPNSGKSLAMRSMAEKTYPKVSQVIFDTMGEYWTLRKQFPDYLLVGSVDDGADLPNDPNIAADLARIVREKGCRVIVDLSDLDEDEQQKFMTNFCNAILKLPRTMWKTPLMVFVEEAHVFAPESGSPPSRKALGKLAKMGRKQKICVVLATQDLAGTSKGVLRSMTNRMYGRFADDSDLKRATDNLGFSGKAQWQTMREMKDGEFHCRGPAFEHRGLVLARTDKKTVSYHPDPGDDLIFKPAPASKAAKVLAKDLAEKAVEASTKKKAEDNEITSLKQRIKELEGGTERKKLVARIDELLKENAATKVAAAKKAPPAKPTVIKALSKGQIAELRKSIAVEFSKIRAQYTIEIGVERKRAFTRASNIFRMFAQAADAQLLDDARRIQTTDAADKKFMKSEIEKILARVEAWSPAHQPSSPVLKARSAGIPASTRSPTPKVTRIGSGPGDSKVTGSVRKILIALAHHPEGLDRDQIAIYSGVSPRSSGLPASLTTLSSNGWTEKRDDKTFATQAGIDALGEYEDLPEGQALVDHWIGFFTGSTSRLLRTLVEAGPGGLERDEAARQSGISITSSGLPASISELTKSKFITVQDRGKHLTASHVLLAAAAS